MDGARDAATRVRHLSCPPRHRTNKSAPLVLPWPLAVDTHAPASTLAWHWPHLGASGQGLGSSAKMTFGLATSSTPICSQALMHDGDDSSPTKPSTPCPLKQSCVTRGPLVSLSERRPQFAAKKRAARPSGAGGVCVRRRGRSVAAVPGPTRVKSVTALVEDMTTGQRGLPQG